MEQQDDLTPESAAADPAEAFEALRREVGLVRSAVELLARRVEDAKLPDYTATLSDLNESVLEATERLAAIEKHPALKVSARDYQHAIAQAGTEALRAPLVLLQDAAHAARTQSQFLERVVEGLRSREDQRTWVRVVAAGALVVGIVISPVLASWLPFGGDGAIAALIVGGTRWEAGGKLMAASDPAAWLDVVDGVKLVRANRDALATCRVAAAKSKKEQRCVIALATP